MKKDNLIRINDVPWINLDIYTFHGTLEEVSANVLNIREQIKQAIERRNKECEGSFTPFSDYKEIKLNIERGYDGDIEVNVICYREKTKEEIRKEAEQEKKRKESAKKAAETRKLLKEKRERTIYENLKKKYGEK